MFPYSTCLHNTQETVQHRNNKEMCSIGSNSCTLEDYHKCSPGDRSLACYFAIFVTFTVEEKHKTPGWANLQSIIIDWIGNDTNYPEQSIV